MASYSLLSSLLITQSKMSVLHMNLFHLLDPSQVEFTHENSVRIHIDRYEELSMLSSQLISSDKAFEDLALAFSLCVQDLARSVQDIEAMRVETEGLKRSVKENMDIINVQMSDLAGVLSSYRERCREGFLHFLKSLDADIRRILKPLVPTEVVKENIKFPVINENPSLNNSAVHSRQPSTEDIPDVSETKQPESTEVTIKKLNTHIQMVVGSLESVAKDLILVLSEAYREYYDLVNSPDFRPQTPLAAPLPEYFSYPNNQEIPLTQPEISKKKILKTLKKMHKSGLLNDAQYILIVSAVHDSPGEVCNIDLLLKKTKLSVELTENITFFLLNDSQIQEKDVSLNDLFSPPRKQKPVQRKFPLIERDKKLDSSIEKSERMRYTPPPDENKRYSPVPKLSNIKGSRRKGLLDTVKQGERKDLRVRSITPLGKPLGSSKRKTKMPVQRRNK